jgi:hypothetical protein
VRRYQCSIRIGWLHDNAIPLTGGLSELLSEAAPEADTIILTSIHQLLDLLEAGKADRTDISWTLTLPSHINVIIALEDEAVFVPPHLKLKVTFIQLNFFKQTKFYSRKITPVFKFILTTLT